MQLFDGRPILLNFYNDERFRDAGIHDLLRDGILNKLKRKEFKFEPELTKTDYVVGYIASLESALDAAVQKLYGIQLGLTEIRYDTMEWEKGTIIIDVIETNNGRLVWREAGQAFASLDEIPQELRKKRIDYFVKEIFSELPID